MLVKLLGIAAATGAIGGAAATIGARLRLRRWETLDTRSLRPPHAAVEIDGISLHVVTLSEGASAATIPTEPPPLLLIHGFGGSTFSFREQFASLNPGRTMLAVDLPGFGLSDRAPERDHSHTAQVERIVALLDRLGAERTVVLGHSMGGSIALRLAAAHPERVAALVLVAAADPNRRFSPRLFPLLRPILPLGLALLASDTRLRQEIERAVSDPAFITEHVADGYLRPLRVRGTGACLLAMLRDVRRDLPVEIGAIEVPTLLIWGEADRIVPPSVGRRLAALLPNARLEIVEGAAHLPLEEQADACNDLLRLFLQRLEIGSSGPIRDAPSIAASRAAIRSSDLVDTDLVDTRGGVGYGAPPSS